MLELTADDLQEMAHPELMTLVLKFQSELQEAHLKLALARITIGDQQASLKNKSNALRNVLRQRKSLKQTVKRRRKHAR